MARLFLISHGICLLLLRITSALAVTDKSFYVIEGASNSDDVVSFELLDNHHVDRRELPIEPSPPKSSTLPALPSLEPLTITTAQSLPPPIPPPEQKPLSKSKEKLEKTGSTISVTTSNLEKPSKKTKEVVDAPTNLTQIDLENDGKHWKNLGVNGTGQRKYNLTTTPSAAAPNLTTSTIPPLLHDIAHVGEIENGGDVDAENITVSKFSDKALKDALEKHRINVTRTDNHLYYNSTIKNDEATAKSYWVPLVNFKDVITDSILSESHRRATTVILSFEFPFYGHLIKNVTIATGGFLYTGDYVHAWLAATQYIAPLMANFDTSLSNDSFIRYYDNGTAFTVEWENVDLQDKPKDGRFTFQTTLLKSGDIIFVYKNIPEFIDKIQDDQHPVKVGLSDAYIIDRTIFFIRRKTIYEYHRVNFKKEELRNWTSIYLTALPTCHSTNDCVTCLTKEIPQFQCFWCSSLQKCSSGLDRQRQAWLTKGCDYMNTNNVSMCSFHYYRKYNESQVVYTHVIGDLNNAGTNQTKPSSSLYRDNLATKQSGVGVSGIMATFFLVVLVVTASIWVLYAYRNPHTTSGQLLIRYRPSQWRWRRGEARYTAATIHM